MIELLVPAAKTAYERQQRERHRQFERRLARLPEKQRFRITILRAVLPLAVVGGGLIIFALTSGN